MCVKGGQNVGNGHGNVNVVIEYYILMNLMCVGVYIIMN